MTERVADLAVLLVDHPLTGSAPLLLSRDVSVSAGEARRAAHAIADELGSLGVQAGQGVAVPLSNGPDAVIAMFGVWLAGAVLIPVNPRLATVELDQVITTTDPSAVIDAYGARRRATERRFDAGTAFVLWTSGTTGRPKPVLHTHAGYLELLDRVLVPLRGGGPRALDGPVSPTLIPVPLALNAGIYNALFGLRAGAPLVIMDGFEPAVFAELVARFEIRSTVLPPAAIGDGWRVANATLSGERQMVSGSGSGGVDRIGGSGVERLIEVAAVRAAAGRPGGSDDPHLRQRIGALLSEERIREWTNQRVRAGAKAGRRLGPESSIGKVHQGGLNQRIQVLATDLAGPASMAWEPGAIVDVDAGQAYADTLPYAVKGMLLRSRANTIEGGTTEVNRNIIAERVLGLPREPDPYEGVPWREVPRG